MYRKRKSTKLQVIKEAENDYEPVSGTALKDRVYFNPDYFNENAQEDGLLLNPSNEANQQLIQNSGGKNKKENGNSGSEVKAEKLAEEAKEILTDIAGENGKKDNEKSNEANRQPGQNPEEAEQKENVNARLEDAAENLIEEANDAQIDAGDEDLTQIDKDMEPAEDLGVQAQKLDPQKSPTGEKKFLSSLAYYSGKFMGKILGTLGTILNMLSFGLFTGSNSWSGTWRRMFGQKFQQRRKNRKSIPGWGGQRFEERSDSRDEVAADFRRVPEVWSYPIAAEGDIGDKKDIFGKKKPRPPVISIYVSQSSDQYTRDENLKSGHTGIGIEYSRKNERTGRWNRYNLRYGFGVGGELGGSALNAVSDYSSATFPGELRDEKNEPYNVSRSYNATPKQVNDVLRASETYADRGGFNAYTRNCTTFAKEMVVDVAKIRGAAPIFEQDTVNAHKNADNAMFKSALMSSYYKADMENKIAAMKNEVDLSYQGNGNRRMSAEEYDRYKKSIRFFSTRTDRTYSANGAAERMYRMEGSNSGKIGIGKNGVQDGEEVRTLPMNVVEKELPTLLTDLDRSLLRMTPEGKYEGPDVSDEFQKVKDGLSSDLLRGVLLNTPANLEDMKQTELIRLRTAFTNIINNSNILLFKYYHNDRNVQAMVLKIIDMANHGIRNVDDAFAKTENRDHEEKDSILGDVKAHFYGKKIKITYKDDRLPYNDEQNLIEVFMTPSHFESYLQIHKTPQGAVRNYARYCMLLKQYETGMFNKNDRRFKELQNLSRVDKVADDFDKSHRYMLEKSKFSQEDMNYIFSLSAKESQGEFSFYKQDDPITWDPNKDKNDLSMELDEDISEISGNPDKDKDELPRIPDDIDAIPRVPDDDKDEDIGEIPQIPDKDKSDFSWVPKDALLPQIHLQLPDQNQKDSWLPSKFVSPANVYQTMIMKSIFGDMVLSRDLRLARKKNMRKEYVSNFLEKRILQQIRRKEDDMTLVLRGIRNSMKEPFKDEVLEKAEILIIKWVLQLIDDQNLLSGKDTEWIVDHMRNGIIWDKMEEIYDKKVRD